jgi:receptor protein-tyrosine kinase
MHDAPKYTTLRDYLRVVREQRVVLVLVVLAFVGAAVVISVRQANVYQARASLSFKNETEDFSDIGAGAPSTQTPEQRAAISAKQIKSLTIAYRAQELMKTSVPAAALLRKVTIQPEARTNFVDVTVKSTDAKFASDLANAFATAAIRVTNERARLHYKRVARDVRRTNDALSRRPVNSYSRAANIDRIARLENLSRFATPAELAVRADQPTNPISPKPIRNTILGVLVGLTFALLIAFIRDALDRRFKSVREIRDELKLPLVGHIRDDMLGRSMVTVNGRAGLDGTELEAFRIMRTNVDFLDVDRNLSPIIVTSALPEEGKSTVAGALAAAYATAGKLTLLLECDLRRPVFAARLGLKPKPGLSDYLAGEATPEQILQPLRLDSPGTGGQAKGDKEKGKGKLEKGNQAATLMCIVAGTATPQPAELLGSERFKAFLDQVSSVYDAVIIDSTPLLSVVDTLELIPNVGGVIVCVRASRTTRDQARAAKAALEHFPVRPAGIVVTGVRAGDEADYGYYSYAYAYQPQTG